MEGGNNWESLMICHSLVTIPAWKWKSEDTQLSFTPGSVWTVEMTCYTGGGHPGFSCARKEDRETMLRKSVMLLGMGCKLWWAGPGCFRSH